VNKVISIIAIYTILLLSVTNLSADQNGNGHGYGIGDGPGNGYGYGHGYDIGNGPGNGNGYGHTGAPPGTNTPEPISSALFILGGAGLGLYKRFKNKG
jgi:hypothetical protein